MSKDLNPFEKQQINLPATAAADQERAIQEVQAAMVVAKRFPRDPVKAMDRILQACSRPTLAENALYAYPRGGETITGPSIRLAEALAQNWGNLQFGIRELDQRGGESTIEAFAWDVETNTRQTKVFQVKHVRYSRKHGNKELSDPRDIYEMTANQGARRLRACILGIIPGDVIDAAVRQCDITLENSVGAPEEEIHKLVEAFGKLGVTPEMLSRRLGHRLETTVSAEILGLRKVYKSIRDNFAGIEDFFEIDASKADEVTERVKAKAAEPKQKPKPKAKKPKAEPEPEPEPQAAEDESGRLYLIGEVDKADPADEEARDRILDLCRDIQDEGQRADVIRHVNKHFAEAS